MHLCQVFDMKQSKLRTSMIYTSKYIFVLPLARMAIARAAGCSGRTAPPENSSGSLTHKGLAGLGSSR